MAHCFEHALVAPRGSARDALVLSAWSQANATFTKQTQPWQSKLNRT